MSPREHSDAVRVCLAGAAPDTYNLGVSALCHATIGAVTARFPGARMTVFDQGRGLGDARLSTPRGEITFERCGARHTRRLYMEESLSTIRFSARVGGLFNRAAQRMLHADAVLDLSGGDSFTDLYGDWRFRAIALPKLIAIENEIPLVLLPQTYGPFRSDDARNEAASIVKAAQVAWARDDRSFDVLRELAGPEFDPARHRRGVDVAFLLDAQRPDTEWLAPVADLLEGDRVRPLAGMNVSGLLFHDPDATRERYGFLADYRMLVKRTIQSLLGEGADVLLVPHVVAPEGHYESDPEACDRLANEIDATGGGMGRLHVLPPPRTPGQAKWAIGHVDWFCGTRMHSAIAALSSGVPTAAVAYSPKTQGVFESCGLGDQVVDPRSLRTDECVDKLLESWRARDVTRATLAQELPGVVKRAGEQFDRIAEFVLADRRSPSGAAAR